MPSRLLRCATEPLRARPGLLGFDSSGVGKGECVNNPERVEWQ
jgi:hypothetical protein